MVKRRIVVIALFGALLYAGCKPNPPKFEICEDLRSKSAVADQPLGSTNDLVIYLDTSASMAGYVSPEGKKPFAISPDGQSYFSKTLLEIRNIVTTLSPQPVVSLRRVDSAISAPTNSDLELSQAALNRGAFVGVETNLAGAIKNFSEPIDKDAETKLPPKFHILITDGVQSANKQNADTSCIEGSDSYCVKKQILELLNSGWGGAVIGIRGEFQGKIYSEIKRTSLVYSSGKEIAKFRPFYLYVFSPDRAALDQLVEALMVRLSALSSKPDFIHEFALTSGMVGGVVQFEIENGSRGAVDVRHDKPKMEQNPRLTVRVATKTQESGVQSFTLKTKIPWSTHAATGGSPDEMLSLLRWQLVPVELQTSDGVRPNFQLTKQEIEDGWTHLTFETGWPKQPGSLNWSMYRLIAQVDDSNPVPPWVRNWSTDVDTNLESAAKTLNLVSSLGNLWKNSSKKASAIVEGCIRVGER